MALAFYAGIILNIAQYLVEYIEKHRILIVVEFFKGATLSMIHQKKTDTFRIFAK